MFAYFGYFETDDESSRPDSQGLVFEATQKFGRVGGLVRASECALLSVWTEIPKWNEDEENV